MVTNITRIASALMVVMIMLFSTPLAYARDGVEYCMERYGTEDINKCTYYLREQGIQYVDPVPAGNSGTCSVANSTDGALSLTYPGYQNESEVAQKFEDFIRETRPNSPWLTVPNVGQKILEEGKKYNANPFIMVTMGKSESHFGTTGNPAKIDNNPFGIKKSGGGYKHFNTVEEGLFNEEGILAGLQKRLSEHSNYKDVKNMYEYFSVHNTGQILYKGDGYYSGDPDMGGAVVSSEGDTGYGPNEYWDNAMNDHNKIFGTDFSTIAPERGGVLTGSTGGACGGTFPAGAGGWDLPGEGPNPLVYFSQLYKCTETPPTKPRDRSSAKTCDKAVGDNAFGSFTYGTGTIEECGCGPTSLATIISTVTGNRTTPDQVAEWSAANGGIQADGCGSEWFWSDIAFQSKFGVSVTSIKSEEVASTLSSGKLVLASLTAFPIESSAVGHISVIRKVDSQGNFFFADTYSGGWAGESPEGASRMPYTQAQISSINKGLWAIGSK